MELTRKHAQWLGPTYSLYDSLVYTLRANSDLRAFIVELMTSSTMQVWPSKNTLSFCLYTVKNMRAYLPNALFNAADTKIAWLLHDDLNMICN